MTTETLTLTDFLLARIAEGREQATDVHLFDCVLDHIDGQNGCTCVIPARLLAKCEADRRIVALHSGDTRGWVQPPYGYCPTCSDGTDLHDTVEAPCPTLRALALPYADHPDYRSEWDPR